MFKNKNTKDYFLVFFCGFLSLAKVLLFSLIILCLRIENLIMLCVSIAMVIFSVLLVIRFHNYFYAYSYSYFEKEFEEYIKIFKIENCKTLNDIENLRIEINKVDRYFVKKVLLDNLNAKKPELENIKNFQQKVREAKSILENISNLDFKNKLQDELDFKIKIHLDKQLKNSIFAEK